MTIQSEVLATLRERVRAIETGTRGSLRGGSQYRCSRYCCSLGSAALDAIAPDGGLAAGTIHEWLSPGSGWGAEALSLVAAREACRAGGALVVIDSAGDFYPPAAERWGIDLQRAIIVRGAAPSEQAWAIEQALRTSSVGAVWGHVGLLDERWLRRFQLSAEQSGCVGLFLRPAAAVREPSWCEARWFCQARPLAREQQLHRWIQVELLRVRGGRAGMRVDLRIDFEQGMISGEQRDRQTLSLSLARQLAHPAARRRAARA